MKKKILSLVCVFALALCCAVPAFAADPVSDRVLDLDGYDTVEVPTDVISYDSEIVMTYIQEFANFTQVPRPSHYTTKMTDYLVAWAEARGIECETEEIGNVIMYLPATEGLEDSPVVAFQAHIDMVAAADEGVEHDWENDALDLIWSSDSLTADGTSLGADNGTGIAFLLTYMDYIEEYDHGPLRIIFTVDEEDGLLGANALDAKYLEDVTYFINVDGSYGGAVISCAGGKYFTFSHEAEWVEVPEGCTAFDLSFSDLQGGHSAGVGNGQANGLVAMADALVTVSQEGIDFNLVSLEGGSANNAIPNSSKATIVIAGSDVDSVMEILDSFAKRFDDSYSATEPDYSFTYGVSEEVPDMALEQELSVTLVELMSSVPNNIHTLLATAEGTESSSNLGMISITEDEISFTCFMRSSSTFQAEQITLINNTLAKWSGFDLDIPVTFATWPLKADNVLADIASEVYYDLTGEEYELSAIHAGVECGEFAEKNEDMYIISTGISGGSDGHTTSEAMNFDGVEEGFVFLTTLAATLAAEG